MTASIEFSQENSYRLFRLPTQIVQVDDQKIPLLDLSNNVSHVRQHLKPLRNHVIQGAQYKVIYTNSGSESNDLALQIALNRMGGGIENLCHIGALEGSYHGSTWLCNQVSYLTSLGENKSMKTGGVKFISRQQPSENTKDTKCMIVECIQGIGGNFDIDTELLKELREKTDLMICDEVHTGFGRTGQTFWAFEKAGIVPDVITCGYPCGGICIIREELEKYLPTPYLINTFGDFTSMSNIMEFEMIGDWFQHEIDILKTKEYVDKITGNGLFVGIHLGAKYDVDTVVKRLKDEFQILASIGWQNTIRIQPPNSVTCFDLRRFLHALENICSE